MCCHRRWENNVHASIHVCMFFLYKKLAAMAVAVMWLSCVCSLPVCLSFLSLLASLVSSKCRLKQEKWKNGTQFVLLKTLREYKKKEERVVVVVSGELVDCCIVKYGGFLQMNSYAYLKKLYIHMSTCLVEFSLAYKNTSILFIIITFMCVQQNHHCPSLSNMSLTVSVTVTMYKIL